MNYLLIKHIRNAYIQGSQLLQNKTWGNTKLYTNLNLPICLNNKQ